MSANLAELPNAQPEAPSGFYSYYPECTFTPTQLIIPPGMSFERWEELGKDLRKAGQGLQFWIGDWIRYGEHEYGEKYAQAIEATGKQISTLQGYVYVAEHVDPCRRRQLDSVDYSTHAEVASLPDDDQERILAEAEADPDRYTVKQVRREVHKVKIRLGKKKSEIQVIQTKEVQAWLLSLHASLLEHEATVPSSAPFLKNMIGAMDGVVLQQSERTVESDCQAILKMFTGTDGTEGVEAATDSDIFQWLLSRFYFMRDPELDDRLEYMACIATGDSQCPRNCTKHGRMLQLVSVEGSRQEGRRGGMLELYRLHPEYLQKLGD